MRRAYSLQLQLLQTVLNHRYVQCQAIGISHYRKHVFLTSGYPLSHFFVCVFSRSIFSNDLACAKLNEHSGVAYPKDDIVQSHEKAHQEEQPLRHDSYLAGEHGDAVVRQLIFVEHDFVEKFDGVGSLEKLEWYWAVGGLKGWRVRCGALIVCAVGPVEGLDDLLDVFELLLAECLSTPAAP